MVTGPTRRAVLAGSLTLTVTALAGCAGSDGSDGSGATGDGGYGGGRSPTPSNPARGSVPQQGDLQLSSPAFDEGDQIPRRYGGREENVNPPLRIDRPPTTAASLALVMDDPDAKPVAGKVWIHWLVWNIDPSRSEIPEDWSPSAAREGENSGGNIGYDGPAPPDTRHTYRFKLFALDTMLDLEAGGSVDELGMAMKSHVIARTQLTGTFAP